MSGSGETRMVGGYEVSASVLDMGVRVNLAERQRPVPGASEREQMDFLWPEWCKNASASIPDGDGILVPGLLDWERDGSREVFTVSMPFRFGADPQNRFKLRDLLRESRGAAQAIVSRVEANVWRIVLSHFRLPELLPFDPARIPVSPDQVYLGLLCEGSDLVWSTREQTHAAVVGSNNSGKTESVKMMLAQFWLKGWEVTVITPGGASLFGAFKGLPRFRLLVGRDDESVEQVAQFLRERVAMMAVRDVELEAACAAWWGDDVDQNGVPVPDGAWTGARSIVYMDESSKFVGPPVRGAHSDARAEAMLSCASSWRDLHKEGRKYRMHCITTDQQPAVPNLGGGDVLNELGFVLAIRSLRQTFADVLFPKSSSPDVREVLVEPGSSPGRGVARGAKAPDGELASTAVNDAAVQIAWLPAGEIPGLLAGGLDGPARVRGPVVDVELATPPAGVGGGAPLLPAGEVDGVLLVEEVEQFISEQEDPEPEVVFDQSPEVLALVDDSPRQMRIAVTAMLASGWLCLLFVSSIAVAFQGLVAVALSAAWCWRGALFAVACSAPVLAVAAVVWIMGSL